MAYYLGVDIGGSKSHALIANEAGQALGFGQAGAGNHETVGYDGLIQTLQSVTRHALAAAGISSDQIAGAGFGIAGYDWPAERLPTLRAIETLGLTAPLEVVNDSLIGLLAGSDEGWGIAVVAGTGCNCHGLDWTRQHRGQVTGGGTTLGEAAGSSELIDEAIKAVAYEWTRRGPATQLTPAFIQCTGAQDIEDLLDGLISDRFDLGSAAAPIVFQVAANGDAVALDLIRWAGRELGELAKCVIRQLGFESLAFDVVFVGSMYDGSPLLTEALRDTIHALAPNARLVRLNAPPVIGAVMLGMEQAGLKCSPSMRAALARSVIELRQVAREQ